MKNNQGEHEQTGDNIVEKLTKDRAEEILNDDVKMSILYTLKKNGPSSFGDILKELGISQPAGTNHIFELKLLGLIDKSSDPPNYNIETERYALLMSFRK
jgi:DNA-binding MarR family transcriptional regulator